MENEAFIELAEQVRQITLIASRPPNYDRGDGLPGEGPGETDHADLGLWCGPTTVNLKRGGTRLGAFSYAEILPRLRRGVAAAGEE